MHYKACRQTLKHAEHSNFGTGFVCLDPAAPSARRVKGEDGRKTTSNYMSDSDLDI